MALVQDAIQEMCSEKGSSSITIGGITFRDQRATEAWAILLGGNELVKYTVDARVQLGALDTRIKSTDDIIKGEADVAKAGFSTHDEAVTSASFKVIYPETIFRESQKVSEAATGGIVFTNAFSSSDTFMGSSAYSTKANMLSALLHNRDKHQVAIDHRFPSDQPKTSQAHAVFSAILRLGCFQAVGFPESHLLFDKVMADTGLNRNGVIRFWPD